MAPDAELIYANADGFWIEWRQGFEIHLLVRGLREAVKRYGLGDAPDVREFQSVARAVFGWMDGRPPSFDKGHPVYECEFYFSDVKEILRPLAGPGELVPEPSREAFFGDFLSRLDEADDRHEQSLLSS